MGRIEILQNGELRIEVSDASPYCDVEYFVGKREVRREDFDAISQGITAAALTAIVRKLPSP